MKNEIFDEILVADHNVGHFDKGDEAEDIVIEGWDV